jgi:hypothetical protein
MRHYQASGDLLCSGPGRMKDLPLWFLKQQQLLCRMVGKFELLQQTATT